MDVSRIGIDLVVDGEGRLVGTITDGDVRRAILANISLEGPVNLLLERKAGSRFARPISAPADAGPATLLRTLQQHRILHLPLVDQDQRVVGLVRMDDFVPEEGPPLQAVIMAGGAGSRLRPLTEDMPKSMLPVGDRPLMELIIQQLRQAGIRRVHLTTHYKGELISQHFGDGRDFGVEIRYVEEEQPLGTAGALSRLDGMAGPLLVINGDILTQVNFQAMLEFHREHGAAMTVAVRQYELHVPYGVVETDGLVVTGIIEKPVTRHLINAGIYLLEPEVCRYIPAVQPYDMPDLIEHLVAQGRKVVSFPIREYWLDIGQPADYRQAQADAVSKGFVKE
jgi:dTDP-glucose pyrophosphorylase